MSLNVLLMLLLSSVLNTIITDIQTETQNFTFSCDLYCEICQYQQKLGCLHCCVTVISLACGDYPFKFHAMKAFVRKHHLDKAVS